MSETPSQPTVSGKTRDELPDDPELLKDLLFAALHAKEDLEHQLAWFKRTMWGRRSEQLGIVPEGQQGLFDPNGEAATADHEPRAEADKHGKMSKETAKTGRGGARAQKRRSFDQMIPKGLTEQVTEIRLADQGCVCSECNEPLTAIGTDRRRRLEYVPGHFVVDVTLVESGVCTKHRDVGIVTAEAPPHAIAGSVLGDQLLTKVVTDKFADNIPLNRQVKRFARKGVRVPSSTLSRNVIASAALMGFIVGAIRKELLASPWLQGDATGMPVVLGDRGQTHRAHLWVYANGDSAVFDITMTKHGKHAEEFLDGFAGTWLADGTSEYNDVERMEGVERAGCWSHARRYLFEAREQDVAAYEGLGMIRELFLAERPVVTAATLERAAHRERHAAPIIDRMRKWLDIQLLRPDVAKRRKSPYPKALGYLHRQWPRLIQFLSDPAISVHNNRSELLLRTPVIGRKNWLFAGSPQGAVANATWFSIMASCMLQGIDPTEYLHDVLPRVGQEIRPTRFSALDESGSRIISVGCGVSAALLGSTSACDRVIRGHEPRS